MPARWRSYKSGEMGTFASGPRALAAKVSTKMLFPLVFCIFPAINMVVLGPAIIGIWHAILPMLAGQKLP